MIATASAGGNGGAAGAAGNGSAGGASHAGAVGSNGWRWRCWSYCLWWRYCGANTSAIVNASIESGSVTVTAGAAGNGAAGGTGGAGGTGALGGPAAQAGAGSTGGGFAYAGGLIGSNTLAINNSHATIGCTCDWRQHWVWRRGRQWRYWSDRWCWCNTGVLVVIVTGEALLGAMAGRLLIHMHLELFCNRRCGWSTRVGGNGGNGLVAGGAGGAAAVTAVAASSNIGGGGYAGGLVGYNNTAGVVQGASYAGGNATAIGGAGVAGTNGANGGNSTSAVAGAAGGVGGQGGAGGFAYAGGLLGSNAGSMSSDSYAVGNASSTGGAGDPAEMVAQVDPVELVLLASAGVVGGDGRAGGTAYAGGVVGYNSSIGTTISIANNTGTITATGGAGE